MIRGVAGVMVFRNMAADLAECDHERNNVQLKHTAARRCALEEQEYMPHHGSVLNKFSVLKGKA